MKSRHLVEPEALDFIERLQRPELSHETLQGLRELVRKRSREARRSPAPGVTTSRAMAPGCDGGPEVPLIVYASQSGTTSRAALLLVHGGGYVLGDAEGEADWSEWLVEALGCVVVAPEYRLAPETPHPGPVMDCYAALKWLHGQARALDVDPARIGIFGGSSGGGLAAALALLARDRKEVPICFQALLYPMLDDRTAVAEPSNPFAGEYVWSRADSAYAWRCLLGHEPGLAEVSPYASPARARDLSGLPPAYIWVGALDLFVDESIRYASRLLRAGVATELHVWPGVTHGNILMPEAPSTRICRASTLSALRRALKLAGNPG